MIFVKIFFQSCFGCWRLFWEKDNVSRTDWLQVGFIFKLFTFQFERNKRINFRTSFQSCEDVLRGKIILWQWWWSSGQLACLLLQKSEFESGWNLQIFCKICVWKERKQTEWGRGWSTYKISLLNVQKERGGKADVCR